MAKIMIILGSKSDLVTCDKARMILQQFGMDYEIHIASAHRTPDFAVNLAKTAEEKGFCVIIAAAGLSAHLPGVLAAHTLLPVIGIPLNAGGMGGMESLLSISQMPAGIPVATMTVGEAGVLNAALFALAIISLSDEGVKVKLTDYRSKLASDVMEAESRLQKDLADG